MTRIRSNKNIKQGGEIPNGLCSPNVGADVLKSDQISGYNTCQTSSHENLNFQSQM